MSRGLRIGYGPPGTFSVTAASGAYSWVGRDADLEYSEAGGGGNMGQVGSYADLDLAAHPIYTLDLGENDYNIFIREGAGGVTATHNASGWPLGGGAFVRLTPPTVEQLEGGLNMNNLWNDNTLGIQDFNVRFEWRANSTYCSMAGTGPKFNIIHTRRNLAPIPPAEGAEERVVMFLTVMNTADNSAYNRTNTLVTAPAQETVTGWSDQVYDDASIYDDPPGTLTYYPNGPQSYYHTNSGDTGTFQGKPLVEVGEVVTFEMRVQTTTSVAYPRGLIAFRMYRENGFVAERGIPWNWDTGVPFGAYIYEIQQLGMGQWNSVPGANAQWADVGTYVTVARDLGGWLGRRNAT